MFGRVAVADLFIFVKQGRLAEIGKGRTDNRASISNAETRPRSSAVEL